MKSNPMKVVLISCVGKKKPRRCKAKDLYDSTWFRYAWAYAQSLKPGRIFILSAKYGLVDPEQVISPYEETLNTKSDKAIQEWAAGVLLALRRQTDTSNDQFTVLAGEKYRRHLAGFLGMYRVPMEGLGIGQQLKWLKERCRS